MSDTSMPEKWPSLYEQLNAVLAAPIPFFVVVAIIAWVAWRAWQWRYKAVFEKQTELYELSRREVGHWKELAERTTRDLTDKIKQLEDQQNLTADTKRQLGSAREKVLTLADQLNSLGQANTSTAALPAFGTLASFGRAQQMDWTSDGWKPRNPTDSTGRSG